MRGTHYDGAQLTLPLRLVTDVLIALQREGDVVGGVQEVAPTGRCLERGFWLKGDAIQANPHGSREVH